jgi:hypothetical protein
MINGYAHKPTSESLSPRTACKPELSQPVGNWGSHRPSAGSVNDRGASKHGKRIKSSNIAGTREPAAMIFGITHVRHEIPTPDISIVKRLLVHIAVAMTASTAKANHSDCGIIELMQYTIMPSWILHQQVIVDVAFNYIGAAYLVMGTLIGGKDRGFVGYQNRVVP